MCNNKPVKIQLYFNSIFLLTHILLYKPSTAAGDLSLQLYSSTQESVILSQVSGHKMSANGYQRFKFSLTIISTAPADGLAPVGARPSAGAVMTIRVNDQVLWTFLDIMGWPWGVTRNTMIHVRTSAALDRTLVFAEHATNHISFGWVSTGKIPLQLIPTAKQTTVVSSMSNQWRYHSLSIINRYAHFTSDECTGVPPVFGIFNA